MARKQDRLEGKTSFRCDLESLQILEEALLEYRSLQLRKGDLARATLGDLIRRSVHKLAREVQEKGPKHIGRVLTWPER